MDAVVIGSGPNGLGAAIALAREGIRVRVREAEKTIGGGARSAALTLPGFVHDVCSAIHPMGIGSPFFRSLPLAEHGLEWILPEIDVAHPLDDGTAVKLVRSIDETADALGEDRDRYRRLIAPMVRRFDALAADVLGPIVKVPDHPFLLGRFGFRGARSARALPFRGARARALVAGLAGHSFMRLDAVFSAAFVLLFAACAHTRGWPMAKGGSQKIADALASILRSHGGEITTSDRVDRLGAGVAIFDTSASALDRIAGDRLPRWYRDRLRRYKRGPGIFKIDYALSSPVPWTAPECRRAGTIHLGGTFEEIALAEAKVLDGQHPDRPFVLAAQQSVFDASRAPIGKHTLWAYCHVPNGSNVDITDAIESQIERFAPGFRDLVLARAISFPRDVEARNANCIGGDISGGSNEGVQLRVRPVFSSDPYATPSPDLYLCSSSTPPGAGVHGMCGVHAARSAMRRSFRRG